MYAIVDSVRQSLSLTGLMVLPGTSVRGDSIIFLMRVFVHLIFVCGVWKRSFEIDAWPPEERPGADGSSTSSLRALEASEYDLNHNTEGNQMTARLRTFTIILMLSMSLPSACSAQDANFLARALETGTGAFKHQVYVPPKWSAGQKWPVVLYLHGAGERGEDNVLQTQVGFGPAIRQYPERFPCIIVFPQCRKSAWWNQPEMEEVALKALELTIKEFNCDTNRIYLTGISMGGYGAWDLAGKNSGKFAAIAPVCGGIVLPASIRSLLAPPAVDESGDPYLTAAKKIGSTPVWIFHGGADPVVPVAESQQMEKALKTLGGTVKYTEYPGVGHNSWDRAYAEPDFPVWLLSHTLSAKQKPASSYKPH
ncbi:MAG TPA: dienelactone hydrolase family protein [Blastocatellia bacterium]|nr:dienelactone hydrolase family protein [Blastocatellia bacterium]